MVTPLDFVGQFRIKYVFLVSQTLAVKFQKVYKNFFWNTSVGNVHATAIKSTQNLRPTV